MWEVVAFTDAACTFADVPAIKAIDAAAGNVCANRMAGKRKESVGERAKKIEGRRLPARGRERMEKCRKNLAFFPRVQGQAELEFSNVVLL